MEVTTRNKNLAFGRDHKLENSVTIYVPFKMDRYLENMYMIDNLTVKKFQVLCLDECTANVDTQTASLLQSTISDEFKGTTVITIAHRISTVLNMDSILILDHGNLVSISQLSSCQLLIFEYNHFWGIASLLLVYQDYSW